MITIKIDDKAIKAVLASQSKRIERAVEKALDQTALALRDAERDQARQSFDRPNNYTINSIRAGLTKGHNMRASVYIAPPQGRGDSYLAPHVLGAKRHRKALELATTSRQMFPTTRTGGAKLDRFGNLAASAAKRIRGAKKDREMVVIPTRRGKLFPGVYERFSLGKGTKVGMSQGRLIQRGAASRKVGRRRISSAIRARGLRPILLVGKDAPMKKRYDFYGLAERQAARFFRQFMARQLAK
ncbi:MAG: hypothetical protein LBU39_01905 [Desulfobulbaceae bacterium]|jgi:hypothetical protein|nr:hypothetical protein [Desulfobulbaceae bacterium]